MRNFVFSKTSVSPGEILSCIVLIFFIADIGISGSASDIGSITLEVESAETSPMMPRVRQHML